MQTDRGLVIRCQQDIAIVQLFRQEGCTSCTLARFCVGGKSQSFTIRAAALPGVSVGDLVEVAVDDADILRVSLLFYGIPLAAFLLGIFGGYGLALALRWSQGRATVVSLICGFILALAGAFPARYLAGKLGLTARITRILQEEHA